MHAARCIQVQCYFLFCMLFSYTTSIQIWLSRFAFACLPDSDALPNFLDAHNSYWLKKFSLCLILQSLSDHVIQMFHKTNLNVECLNGKRNSCMHMRNVYLVCRPFPWAWWFDSRWLFLNSCLLKSTCIKIPLGHIQCSFFFRNNGTAASAQQEEDRGAQGGGSFGGPLPRDSAGIEKPTYNFVLIIVFCVLLHELAVGRLRSLHLSRSHQFSRHSPRRLQSSEMVASQLFLGRPQGRLPWILVFFTQSSSSFLILITCPSQRSLLLLMQYKYVIQPYSSLKSSMVFFLQRFFPT